MGLLVQLPSVPVDIHYICQRRLPRVIEPIIAAGQTMHLLITLLLAHLLADFPLQTNTLANRKATHGDGVFYHVLIHVLVTALLLHNSHIYWPLPVGIGIVHFLIDVYKLWRPAKQNVRSFVLDQCMHVISLGIAAALALQAWQPAPRGILPDAWLIIMLGGATVPASLVLLWVWTNTLTATQLNRLALLRWIKPRLLEVEQQIGLFIIGAIFWQPALRVLATLVQNIR